MESEGWAFRLEDNMTNEQRERITALRHQGHGYTTIANAVGLSKDSVKAFCRNHGRAGVKAECKDEDVPADNTCVNCGAPLVQRPGVKKKKFCNSACRQTWWNTHPAQVNRKALYPFTCPACGKAFTAYGNNHRKYCSRDCYVADRFKGGDGS